MCGAKLKLSPSLPSQAMWNRPSAKPRTITLIMSRRAGHRSWPRFEQLDSISSIVGPGQLGQASAFTGQYVRRAARRDDHPSCASHLYVGQRPCASGGAQLIARPHLTYHLKGLFNTLIASAPEPSQAEDKPPSHRSPRKATRRQDRSRQTRRSREIVEARQRLEEQLGRV